MSSTLFTKVDYALGSLIDAIANGQIGLPDIQRPFVWKNVKVRELFDSMYRGYPVGYLLFWETGVQSGARKIGTDEKQLAPNRVIVDGQQRLTSLFAVIKGIAVVRENYANEKIEIAFNPLDGRFEVPDAAIRRNKAFIPSISAIWDPKTNLIQFAGDYVTGLRSSSEVSPDDVDRAQKALGRLHSLLHFPFTALELSSHVEPEQVADVFVRINSEGKKLNQSDFILTLMSVFWDEGRFQLESFCKRSRTPTTGVPSPYNYLFQPFPDQLLRVAVAVGFRRARLSAIYAILRAKNADGEDLTTNREQHFDALKTGQAAALNVQFWQDFLHCVVLAGYRTAKIITSELALTFAYSLYLIGRTQLSADEHELKKTIAQWLFMSSLTGRYTSSPESQMEFDLARMRAVKNGDEFLSIIKDICASAITGDFWSITLPSDLATSAARGPSMFAFFASLNVLDARALYSNHSVRELMDLALQGPRSSLERHHLFPVAYLKQQGIQDQRDYNQIANFAIVEWGDNTAISAAPPAEYVPALEKRFDAKMLQDMYRHHALPLGWHNMDYEIFLKERRILIAQTIRMAYERLAGQTQAAAPQLSVAELIGSGETAGVEFKSTLRTNLHTGEKDPRMETAALKSIAGFLNGKGGTLVIGVADDGSPVGWERDGFPDEDYTPPEVVAAMVSLVDQSLRSPTRFGLHRGLAASGITLADPAVGTGTFLLGVLRRIAKTVEDDEGVGARPTAIVAALKRLAGFEMQFGPFAVAQLRLFAEVVDLTTPAAAWNGKKMKPLADASHLRLYVADTLADPDEDTAWIPTSLAGLAQSRKAANAIKRKEAITVVIGNPPYKEKAKGMGGWVESRGGALRAPLDDWQPPLEWGIGAHAKQPA
jgi:hypothetical protein